MRGRCGGFLPEWCKRFFLRLSTLAFSELAAEALRTLSIGWMIDLTIEVVQILDLLESRLLAEADLCRFMIALRVSAIEDVLRWFESMAFLLMRVRVMFAGEGCLEDFFEEFSAAMWFEVGFFLNGCTRPARVLYLIIASLSFLPTDRCLNLVSGSLVSLCCTC